MFGNFTDVELRKLRGLPKRVCNLGARWSEKPTTHPVHRQCTFRATATSKDKGKHQFLIYQRENFRDKQDFSCGIVSQIPSGPRLTPARYYGPAHQHGPIRYRPHIHQATGAAIEAGSKPEHAAEETDRYTDFIGALACLIEDFKLSGIPARHTQPGLLDGH